MPGLSHAWSAGGVLYHRLGRIDAWHGAASWAEGLDWLIEASARRPISEIQFWGHGEWGGLWIAEELMTAIALEPDHALHARLAQIRDRLVGPRALWWFRSCDVFGTQTGHEFATSWTRFFGCRAAGHTYTIKILQSGLHQLEPGAVPDWPVTEGVIAGKDHARSSHLFAPRTITCFHNAIPTGRSRWAT